ELIAGRGAATLPRPAHGDYMGIISDGGSESNGRPGGLLPHHRADLRASGLTDDQIARCGFYSESDPAAVAGLLGWKGPATVLGPCLCIPFRGPDGRPAVYVRVKPDCPRERKGKPAKYEAPVGRPVRAYL